MIAAIRVFESADHELAAQQDSKQIEVVAVKQIKPAIGPVIGPDGLGYLVEPFDSIRGIVDGAEKFDVAPVGVMQELDEVFEAVDAFLHRREFEAGAPIAVYYLAVVFKEGDVGGGRLDAQHDVVLVVHFYGSLSHVVLEPGALNWGVEVIAHVIFAVCMKLPSKEGGDVVRFDGVGGGTNQLVIKWRKVNLAIEHDVGGVFDMPSVVANQNYLDISNESKS